MSFINRTTRWLLEGELDFSTENWLTWAACATLVGYCLMIFTGRAR